MLPGEYGEALRKAADLLRHSRLAIALTGAGSSTPSGIPDFRSAKTGLWNRSDPMVVASLTAFTHHPKRFYDWFKPLASSIIAARPNPAHIALAKLEKAGIIKALITQNIDGLHQRAGSENVLDIHGSLRYFTCPGCYTSYPSEGLIRQFLAGGGLPLCKHCQSILKPGIVLFEETIPMDVWEKAQGLIRDCDVLIVCGSSLVVTPVADLPLQAIQNGAHLIINNLSPTYLDDYADVLFPADLAQVLPQLAEAIL